MLISVLVLPWDIYETAGNAVSSAEMGKALLGVIVNPVAKGQAMIAGAQEMKRLATEGKSVVIQLLYVLLQ